MPAEEVRKKFQAPLLRPVLDFAEVWFEHAKVITFHDPLAATTIFDNSICGYERGQVDVELKSERLAGTTLWTPKPKGRMKWPRPWTRRSSSITTFSFFE